MKLSCLKENLNKALNIVNRAVSLKGQLPVLRNILFTTEKGGLRITATDLEIAITTWLGAKIEKQGALTIPVRLINDFVASNNDEIINLEVKNETLFCQSKHFEANIKGIKAEEFPKIPNLKKEKLIEVSAIEFKQAINQVVFACAYDDTRPVLTAILCRIKNKELKLVATDSYRLAEKKLSISTQINSPTDLLVLSRSFNEVSRIINPQDEKITIYLNDNQAMFEIGETQIISRLIEGVFPDYQQIIPQKSETEAVIETNLFLNAVKMASFFARENANNVKFFLKEPNKIEVKAVSPQLGDETSKLEGEVKGKEVEIAFNAKYIIDVLGNFPSEKVILGLSGSLSPGIIRPLNDKSYFYVIMPLRVDE